ncbi:MAG: hypothetical protein M1818_003735 [Claussenomyces sp. TS43310]|nr:MAG: hypothetical protein M1818_003735 [Claussenomyces sp. TS43310]
MPQVISKGDVPRCATNGLRIDDAGLLAQPAVSLRCSRLIWNRVTDCARKPVRRVSYDFRETVSGFQSLAAFLRPTLSTYRSLSSEPISEYEIQPGRFSSAEAERWIRCVRLSLQILNSSRGKILRRPDGRRYSKLVSSKVFGGTFGRISAGSQEQVSRQCKEAGPVSPHTSLR